MNNWRRAAFDVMMAVVILGFCLYFVLNYLVSIDESIVAGFEITYLASTMLREVLPWFFLTSLCFILISAIVGLYVGLHVTVKRLWEIAVYVFAPSFLIAFLQSFSFFWLIGRIPTLPGLGTFTQETTLGNFFVGTCGFPLFCFVLVSVGIGLHIGLHVDRET